VARRSTLRNAAEFAPAWLVVQVLRWAPLPLAKGIAAAIFGLGRVLTPRWRQTAQTNLALAFPDWKPERRARAVCECYRNLGRNLLALARLPRLTSLNIGHWIRYEGFEHYEEAISKGRGVIFLTAHLGAWELSAAAHALYGHPMWLMVRPLDNPFLDRLVDARRRLFGNRTIRKKDSAREVLAVLRSNGAVGILADQNAGGADGVFVDLFGRKASATKGVAQIAARTGAAVVPGFAVWNDADQRYVLKFYPTVALVDSSDREADLVENTQRCQSAIELAIRDSPGQWLWIHRRWKRQPDGQPAVY
jgi:Kdo2-lipid IVA lauroyltransferase/acyltransferase